MTDTPKIHKPALYCWHSLWNHFTNLPDILFAFTMSGIKIQLLLLLCFYTFYVHFLRAVLYLFISCCLFLFVYTGSAVRVFDSQQGYSMWFKCQTSILLHSLLQIQVRQYSSMQILVAFLRENRSQVICSVLKDRWYFQVFFMFILSHARNGRRFRNYYLVLLQSEDWLHLCISLYIMWLSLVLRQNKTVQETVIDICYYGISTDLSPKNV